MNEIQTKKSALYYADECWGLVGEARTAYLRGARDGRVHRRIQAVIATADGNAAKLFGLAVLDKAGVGGPRFLPLESDTETATTRVPEWSRLGTGRKKSHDGGAWDAAIEAALLFFNWCHRTIEVRERGIRVTARLVSDEREYVWESLDSHRLWVAQLARRYLYTAGFEGSATPPPIMGAEVLSPLWEWGRLLARLGSV